MRTKLYFESYLTCRVCFYSTAMPFRIKESLKHMILFAKYSNIINNNIKSNYIKTFSYEQRNLWKDSQGISSQKEIIFLCSVEVEMTLWGGQVVPKQFFHPLCFLWHNRGECRMLKTCICFSATCLISYQFCCLLNMGKILGEIGRVKSPFAAPVSL